MPPPPVPALPRRSGSQQADGAARGDRRGGRPDYRTVRVDNQAALPVQVDVAGPGGGRLGLGTAGPRATTTFAEVADPGGTWTFVVSYGAQELLRQPVSGQELAGRDWTFQVPDDVTMELERQGYR